MYKKYILIILCLGMLQLVNGQTAFTKQQLKDANTGADSKLLTELEKEVIQYVNLVRMFPKQFCELYVDSMAGIKNQTTHKNLISLKETLLQDSAVGALLVDDNLIAMAKAMADDVGPTGVIGHTNSKGETFSDRLKQFDVHGYTAENISYGSDNPLMIVYNWLIDVHASNLGHRKNTLNPNYKFIGVQYAPHSTYSHCFVADFRSGL